MTHGYFKPLRRKFGVVTLSLACAFMAGWMRSQTISESISFRGSPSRVHVLSSRASFLRWNCRGGDSPERFYARTKFDHDSIAALVNDDLQIDHRWRMCGFQSVSGLTPSGVPTAIWIIPFASIVIPLTLLSVWLLLSKPRPKKVVQ
jgi:hypothetical protein